MNKQFVSIILSVLLIGIGNGYVLGYTVYQPQISSLQSEISTLKDYYVNLNSSYANLQKAYYQLYSLLNAKGSSFPIFPTYNFSSIAILVDQTINETFMELKYSMGCEWSLGITEFLVNSMTIEEINETTMAYLSNWVKNVLLGDMTFIGEEVLHGHTILIYGIHPEDKKIYAWYCDVSGILFIIWSEAYCDWTYETVRAVVESVDCH